MRTDRYSAKHGRKQEDSARGRKKRKWLLPLILMLLIILIAGGVTYAYYYASNLRTGSAYAASASPTLPVYTIDEGNIAEEMYRYATKGFKASEYATITRGAKLVVHNLAKTADGRKYYQVEGAGVAGSEETGDRLYIAEDNLSDTKEGIVQENEVYVRTPATIYVNHKGPAIASFAAKGSSLEVTGFDRLEADGSVNKYKIRFAGGEGEETEGYVYGKYTTRDKEEAEKVYSKVYKKVKNDNYGMNLYGGKAANLDYFPSEKTSIEGNKFCEEAEAMYINGAAAVNSGRYVKLIESTKCNAVVIDIKDGYLSYKSKVAKEISPKSYKSAYSTRKEFKKGVDAFRETGAYLIGRIVVFNDALYAKDHPEDCIKYKKSSGWPSAYSRNVWEYNVRLAIEAVREFGFNEIQFDYVRFPENAYEMSKSGKADFKNIYDEEKGQAVQNFCMYAADMLHEEGAYMSVDVFGESAYGYMTAYGQYWPGIANVVDAISAMPYTDHMGADGSWDKPGKTVLAWAKKAKMQQDKIENPAAARTWITGYNTPNWNPTHEYKSKELKAQVNALKKAGLTGGFIPWNGVSDISKYREYAGVWK